MLSLLYFLSCGGRVNIDPEDIVKIRVEPNNIELYTSLDSPAEMDFVAYAVLDNDKEYRLDLISWESSNLSAGSLDENGLFTSIDTNGGITDVVANHFGKQGSARVKVIYTDDINIDVDEDVIQKFQTANSASQSEDLFIDYPADGVMVPRNLDGFGFRWDDTENSDNTVYRLHLRSEITDISVYTTQYQWISSSDLWALIGATNSDGEVTVSVQAAEWYNGNFSSLRESKDISLIINRLDARGSVYYWSSSNEGIMRIPLGTSEAEVFWDNSTNLGGGNPNNNENSDGGTSGGNTSGGNNGGTSGGNQNNNDPNSDGECPELPSRGDEPIYDCSDPDCDCGNNNGGNNTGGNNTGGNTGGSTPNTGCVGCHSVYKDRMVVTHDGHDGRFTILGVEKTDEGGVTYEELVRPADQRRMTFKTLSPDGDYILGSNDNKLTLYAMDTGIPLKTWQMDTKVSHPDWSPDGSQIVFTRINGNARSDREFWGGSIVQMQIDIENLSLQDEVVLKAYNPDISYFYPAYSPDGEWIIYVQASNSQELSVKGASAKADAPDDRRLWLMSREGYLDIPLNNANQAFDGADDDLLNSYPRWGPLPDDDILWISFSSIRDYPLVGEHGEQIWVSGINPELAYDGLDPSTRAFWLPGQESNANNHIPVWSNP